jgi:outer membrane protein TolC
MNKPKDEPVNEQALVKLYMDLTGANEAAARSVFMHVCPPGSNTDGYRPEDVPAGQSAEWTAGRPGAPAALLTLALLWLALFPSLAPAAVPASSTTNSPLFQPLSLADAVNVALQRNPNIQRAAKDIEAAHGVSLQVRAIAIPKVVVTGSFNAVAPGDVDVISVPSTGSASGSAGSSSVPPGFTFGVNKNWVSQIRLEQSIYEGGRILSALKVSRLTRERAHLNYQATVADTVLSVEVAYFDALLAQQQIVVQEASVDLLTRELTDTTRRYDAGTVPRFNVLRAEVSLANARPQLIRARNSFRIAKNNLANLLGLNVPKETFDDIPMVLTGKLEAEPYQIDLPRAIVLALERRPELGALRKTQALRREDIVSAKAGYLPNVQAFAGYDVHNSMLHSDLSFEDHGWITGVQLNWNLFDGMNTRGRVEETTALFERAGIDLDDTSRSIELEVRTTYSNFTEAQEVLESQKKVVAEAEESHRLATSRYDAGTGTQLDVLGAETDLTQARTTQVEALHGYDVARARLARAIGALTPEQK